MAYSRTKSCCLCGEPIGNRNAVGVCVRTARCKAEHDRRVRLREANRRRMRPARPVAIDKARHYYYVQQRRRIAELAKAAFGPRVNPDPDARHGATPVWKSYGEQLGLMRELYEVLLP